MHNRIISKAHTSDSEITGKGSPHHKQGPQSIAESVTVTVWWSEEQPSTQARLAAITGRPSLGAGHLSQALHESLAGPARVTRRPRNTRRPCWSSALVLRASVLGQRLDEGGGLACWQADLWQLR